MFGKLRIINVSASLVFVTYQLWLIEAFTTHGLSNPISDVGIIGSRSKTQLFFDSPDEKSKLSKTQLFFDGPDEKSKFELWKFDPLDLAAESPIDNAMNNMSINAQNIEEVDEEGNLSVWAARGLLLVVAILWGTNFASVKYLETLCFNPPCNHPPSEAAFARFGLAAIGALPFLINQRIDIIIAGLECGFWIALGYFAQAIALSTISSGQCAFICSLTVVVVPLISAVFFGKKIQPVNIISGIAAIMGVGVLEGMVDFNELLHIQPAIADTTAIIPSGIEGISTMTASTALMSESVGWFSQLANTLGVKEGDLIAFGQPIGFGISFMRIEHYVDKFKDTKNRVLTIAAAECIAVGFLSLLWVLNDYQWTLPNFEYMIEPHRLGAIAWTGIMTTGVAIYLEGFALQVLTATDAALTFASEPVWATLFGAWLLHESMNTNSYVGGALILGACIMSSMSDTNEGEIEMRD
mmetsp:Transcript_23507/g.27755  ORF Transcript_23507/g.27755 Transcript_23507/m.27755 type:complete len:468 (-) Transcript_23507:425-1828(-)|eukprot:CAMPEP_0198264198 /NCGR_PEP_ID=MMETSP1447-20131203/14942_1 /TAXON_ID=420782 /ORGANISM="Chaetoceros dichaeta, Strain CCMP1751" /LENGTH=467 /DNA_ID=CAMNT_0043953059 /DNA_START=73 /DNA_END=1476 /DNA_ORIENTATION=-